MCLRQKCDLFCYYVVLIWTILIYERFSSLSTKEKKIKQTFPQILLLILRSFIFYRIEKFFRVSPCLLITQGKAQQLHLLEAIGKVEFLVAVMMEFALPICAARFGARIVSVK